MHPLSFWRSRNVEWIGVGEGWDGMGWGRRVSMDGVFLRLFDDSTIVMFLSLFLIRSQYKSTISIGR